jgi:RNA polymerase sigma-32 factor
MASALVVSGSTAQFGNGLGKQSASMAGRDPFSLVPSLGNLDAYISAANRLPLLEPEEEKSLAAKFRQDADVNAAGRLVLSHLRLVISISRQYVGYGLPQADLIQEGNIGLMKAVKRFDPDQNVRLVSYAMHWIKAEIHEYILKNWRLVKIATTKAQRKLFFNLRSMKSGLEQADKGASGTGVEHESLTARNVDTMARRLNVKREEVLEMEARFAGGDIALEGHTNDDGEESYSPIAYLADANSEPVQVLANRERDHLQSHGIERAMELLDPRSRRIIQERWLRDADEGGGMTLHELASEYGVSAERIRQIEVAALKKMRKTLEV